MSATKKSPNFKSLLKSKQNITPIKTKEDAPSDFELNEEENVEEQIEVNKKRKIEEEEDVADDVDDVDLQDNDLLTEEGEDGLNIFGEVIGEEGQEAQEEVEASEVPLSYIGFNLIEYRTKACIEKREVRFQEA